MAKARTVTAADGSTHLFPVSFPLPPQQGRLGVNVYVHPASDPHPGVALATSAFTWVSDGQINVTAAPALGTVVDIRRNTLDTALDNTVQAGGSLRAQDLVQNDTQLLYLVQEREDADADLQSQLDVESAARLAGDGAEATTRAAAITAEAAARTEADNALQAEINTKADTGAFATLSALIAAGAPPPTIDVGVSPEQFGAVGNGVANDTSAFQALAAFINGTGGGTIIFRPGALYLVGKQDLVNDGTYMFKGQKVLTLDGCTRGLTIVCNGAKFVLAAGLKFGAFHADGTAAPNFTAGSLSSPVEEAILVIKNCTGRARVHGGLEIDGNQANIALGGQYGDIGWQVPGDGCFFINNSGGESFSDIYSHDNPRDNYQAWGGGVPITSATPEQGSVWVGCRGYRAGRNGLSLTGGRGYTFIGCRWIGAGKGTIASPPSACLDLEVEQGKIRDIHFIGCEFADAAGAAMVADSGDTARVTFDKCRFINGVSWCAWIAKPTFAFHDCLFAGSINFVLGTLSQAEMPRFIGCEFTDDTAYLTSGAFSEGVMFNGRKLTALFERCIIRGMNHLSMCSDPGDGGVFQDCTFILGASGGGIGGMKLRRRNEFTAAAPFGLLLGEAGDISGEIVYNGTTSRTGSKVYNPPSTADGATFTTTVTVPLATLNDTVRVSFSNSPQGISFAESYVSVAGSEAGLAGVVTVIGRNNTGGVLDLASGTLRVAVQGINAL